MSQPLDGVNTSNPAVDLEADLHAPTRAIRDRSVGVGLVGSLSKTPLPEVFNQIASHELSGDLQVISGKAIRTVYFDRGFVVFAGSNLKRDRLGQCLLESGRVTERELEIAFQFAKGKRRIGEAVVDAGLMTEEELGREVAHQARRIALSLFGQKDGIYSFDERPCSIPIGLRLGLSIYRLQLEGVRRMNNATLIQRGLGALDRALRASDIPPFSYEYSELRPLERQVLAAVGDEDSLSGILKNIGQDRSRVLRAIYSLLCAGILQDVAERRVMKVQEETGTFLLSELDKGGDVRAANVRQEVLLSYDALERSTAGELLNVDPSASTDDIRRAYDERRQEWELKQKRIDNETTLVVKVEEIHRRLAEARERLIEEKQGGPTPRPLPAAGQVTQHSIELLKEAPSQEGDDSPPSQTRFKGSSELPPAREWQPPGAEQLTHPSASRGAETTQLVEEKKRLLNEIKVRKMVKDTEGTISLLYELIRIDPDNAKYEVSLALTMASHPVMQKRAERHFRRAVSLDPQNAEYHFQLGRYYQGFNMKGRALNEFKTTLRIDPQHADARAALVEMKQVDGKPVQQILKRFFS